MDFLRKIFNVGRLTRSDKRSLRLICYLFALLYLLGAVGDFFLPADDILRSARLRFAQEQSTGRIGFVSISSSDMAGSGAVAPARDLQAKAIERLNEGGAEAIAIDYIFVRRNEDSSKLVAAIENSKVPVITGTRLTEAPGIAYDNISRIENKPAFVEDTESVTFTAGIIAEIAFPWTMPDLKQVGTGMVQTNRGKIYPLYQELAGVRSERGGIIDVIMTTDMRSIPRIKFADLIRGDVPADVIRGKRWLISVGDTSMPQEGKTPVLGRNYQTLGVATLVTADSYLKHGFAKPLGAVPALLFTFMVIVSLFVTKRVRFIYWLAPILLVVGTIFAAFLELQGYLLEIMSAVVFAIAVSLLLWLRSLREVVGSVERGLGELDLLQLANDRSKVLYVVDVGSEIVNAEDRSRAVRIVIDAFDGADAFILDTSRVAIWHDAAAGLLNREHFEALGERIGSAVSVGVSESGADVKTRLNEAKASADFARRIGIVMWSGDKPGDASEDGIVYERANEAVQVYDLHYNVIEGLFVDLTNVSDSAVLNAKISEALEAEAEILEGELNPLFWIAVEPSMVLKSEVVDHFKFVVSSTGMNLADIVVTLDGVGALANRSIFVKAVSDLRNAGFQVCLGGYGKEGWDAEGLRDVRATQLLLSGDMVFNMGQAAAQAILTDAVEAADVLDRRLLITNIDSSERLAMAKWAKVDFVAGKAVREIETVVPFDGAQAG